MNVAVEVNIVFMILHIQSPLLQLKILKCLHILQINELKLPFILLLLNNLVQVEVDKKFLLDIFTL